MPPFDAAEDCTQRLRDWRDRGRRRGGRRGHSAARMPPASGWYSGWPFSGLTQTTANAWRARRSISAATSSGPRARNRRRGSRRPHLASAPDAPTRRCTPSGTRRSSCRPTSRRRASQPPRAPTPGSRVPSSGVRRESRVPKRKVSTPRPDPRAAWRYSRSARAYASIEPEMSSSSTSFRGACARLR